MRISLSSREFDAQDPSPLARLAFYRAWVSAVRSGDEVSILVLQMAALGLAGGAPGIQRGGSLQSYGEAVYAALSASEDPQRLVVASDQAALFLISPLLPPKAEVLAEARDFSEARAGTTDASSPASESSTTETPSGSSGGP